MPAPDSFRHIIGVDVGGTKTLALSLAFGGRDAHPFGDDPTLPDEPVTLDRERVGSAGRSADAIDHIEAAIRALIERAPVPPEAIGVGMAGFVGRDGIARASANTPGLVGVDVPGRLRESFGVPVVVDNDANCVAIAARATIAPQAETMVAVTLGTGIGGGLIINGGLYRGANGFAGEPGHMVIDPAGPVCPCGQRGCWERYASGSGLAWLAREAAAAGRATTILAAAGSLAAITGEHVTTLVDAGEAEALELFTEFAGYVALGIANLSSLLDPELVVIGGGLASQGERLAELVREALWERWPNAIRDRHLRLVVAPEGPDAGAVGAGLLAASHLFAGRT
ncbi:ROK family glucokinase [soil metagenome]